MHKVLVIDNYDSFTYNLVHALQELLNHKVEVKRNDQVDMDYIDQFDYIILSPGPGIPDEAGDLKKIIERFAPTKKILGVCLGQQAIGEVFGAKLRNLDEVYHGVQTAFKSLGNCSIFDNMDSEFLAGRYHSWVIDKDTLPDELMITCTDEYNEVMGIKHSEYDVYGVQFHPESVLTPEGEKMLSNFLSITN
jgi:anthranilate synthase component 2